MRFSANITSDRKKSKLESLDASDEHNNYSSGFTKTSEKRPTTGLASESENETPKSPLTPKTSSINNSDLPGDDGKKYSRT